MIKQHQNLVLLFLLLFSSYCISCSKQFQIPKQDIANEHDTSTVDITSIDSAALKVLLIGSSYFQFSNLSGIINDIALAKNKKIYLDTRLKSGEFLKFHASDKETNNKIKSQKWDYVILQGAGVNVAYPDPPLGYPYSYPAVLPALTKLTNTIKNNYDSTKVVFMMPWAFEDGLTWYQGGTDTYEIMQAKIYSNTLQFLDLLDIGIAPVGLAWNEIMNQNPPLHYLFKEDYNHPSMIGSYLMAFVIYVSIFQETLDLPDNFGLINQEELNNLVTVAESTVLENLELWNLISTETTSIAK